MRINKKQQQELIATKLNKKYVTYDKTNRCYFIGEQLLLNDLKLRITIFVHSDSITARFDLKRGQELSSWVSAAPFLYDCFHVRNLETTTRIDSNYCVCRFDELDTYDYWYRPNINTYMVYRKKCNPNNWYHLDLFLNNVNECIEDVRSTLLQVAQ